MKGTVYIKKKNPQDFKTEMPGTLSSQNHTQTDLDHEAGGQNMNISRFKSLGEPTHLFPLLSSEKRYIKQPLVHWKDTVESSDALFLHQKEKKKGGGRGGRSTSKCLPMATVQHIYVHTMIIHAQSILKWDTNSVFIIQMTESSWHH